MLRLGLATPSKSASAAAASQEQDSLRDAFHLPGAAAAARRPLCDGSGSVGVASEQESTTASNSEHDEDANSVGNDATSSERPCAKAPGLRAKTRVGSFVSLPPGLRAPPGTPSHGSALHKIGTCWPCAYFWKHEGCPKGEDCLYCHLCPQGEMKLRKRSKQAMMRLGLATPRAAAGAQGEEA